jgi:hypothetical protein
VRKINLLVTTGDFSKYISPEFHYLLMEVAKLTNLTVWHESGDIKDILKKVEVQPDFIFINEFGESNSPKITGLSTLDIPFAVNLYDIHYHIKDRKEALHAENVKHIFVYYRDKFLEWYPEFAHMMKWLPKHINPAIFKDYKLEKEIDYLLMGAVHHRVYPIRHKVVQAMKDEPGFVYHEHPGYRNIDDDEENVFAGEKYAKEINRSKIFFTCNSRYEYVLTKYLEVPAARTLLLAPSSKELEDMGFVPGEHFVEINEDNFQEKAQYYLENESERYRISKQGYLMVHEHHTTKKRAKQFVELIQEIITNEQK